MMRFQVGMLWDASNLKLIRSIYYALHTSAVPEESAPNVAKSALLDS